MDEPTLRKVTRDWIERKYKNYSFLIKPIVFHDLGVTLKYFVFKHFSGSKLTDIPNYKSITIKPDVVALVNLPESHKTKCAWIVVECKAKRVITYNDFREFMDQAIRTHAYDAYLVYDKDNLSHQVFEAFRSDSYYTGINKWGAFVKKSVKVYEHNNGSFKKLI